MKARKKAVRTKNRPVARKATKSKSRTSSFQFSADKPLLKLKARLAADEKAVDAVVQSVMRIVRQTGCANGKEEAVELALAEALANAVIHGAKADASKIVECDVACDENRTLLIVVRDPGIGFDPGKVPSPIQGEHIYSNSGRGIFLINQLMDEVKFRKKGTEIHMIKR